MDTRLLDLLVCPVTHGPLRYDAQQQELISPRARLAFPLVDGIPVMLIDRARRLNDDAAADAAPTAPVASDA